MKKSVYNIVTERIIEKLEQGTIPWKKPWNAYPAVNWVTQKPYRGINQLLLGSGEYATWNQVKKAGGSVKKGAKSEMVTFFKMLEVEKGNEIETIPMLRYYRVFNIKDCERIEPKQKVETFEHDPIEEAERLVQNYTGCPEVVFGGGRASYAPGRDIIKMPERERFYTAAEYYSTLFHEMVHSTGHAGRLNRDGIEKYAAFGSERYSKEELVAEIGASMLCGVTGIGNTIDNSVAYIQGWLGALKADSRLIVSAASQAQKAADYILGQE